ncbi:MAG: hypothetical protein J3K34DRAFT_375550, partial [Monoraphidium minutum]
MEAERPGCAIGAAPVAEALVYKSTRFTDVVVQRRVRLFRDRLQTQHSGGPDAAAAAEKSWALDRACRLEPESADDIPRQTRVVRPPGTWTVTAAATAKGQPIELYCLSLHWPSSWLATKAYTSCGLCFATQAEAQHWHGLLSRQLALLRLRGPSNAKSAGGTAARWVPYRHTNGVAIYRHPQEGEYMASSIVKGTPEECLAVLMDLGSHVTILGPASDIECLGGSEGRQVLRIRVEATGMARRCCAPREAVVERVSQAEDSGVNVVLFSSIDDARPGGGGGAGGGAGGGRWFGSAWPVVARVRGGYTISPKEGPQDGQGPPECLVTCILKVDLGGAMGDGSWLRPLADAIGWVDAYVERMLMAVILVKDEIEQRRFLVQPFAMLSSDPPPPRGR